MTRPWVRIDREALEDLVAMAQEAGGVWRRGAVVALLALAQDDAAHPTRPIPIPGRRALCAMTGWTDRTMRSLLASEVWRDEHKTNGRVPPASRERPAHVPPASRERPASHGSFESIADDPSRERPAHVPPASRERPADVHTRVDPHSPPHHPQGTLTDSESVPSPAPEVTDEPPEEVQVLAPSAASSATPCEVPQAPRDSGRRPEGNGEVQIDRVNASARAHAGDAARLVTDRWEDSDAWHAMAADYRTIAERLGGTVRKLDPSTTAGKALVALAKSRRGEVCAMRLRLVAAALTGEPTTAAAHACATRWAPRDAAERGWSATLAALTRLDGGTTCQAIDVEAEQVIAGELVPRLPRASLATVPSAAGTDPVSAPLTGLDARGVEALLNARRAKRAQADAVLVVIDEPMMLEVRDADGG